MCDSDLQKLLKEDNPSGCIGFSREKMIVDSSLEKGILLYTGAYRDPVTGGYPLGNGYRVYLPELMRFVQPDGWSPFGKGGMHPYVYGGNDPINHSDPTGHFGFSGIGLQILAIGLMMVPGAEGVGEIVEEGAIAGSTALRATASTGEEAATSVNTGEQAVSSISTPATTIDSEWGAALALPRALRIPAYRENFLIGQGRGLSKLGGELRDAKRKIFDMRANVKIFEEQAQSLKTRVLADGALAEEDAEYAKVIGIQKSAKLVRSEWETLSESFSHSASRRVPVGIKNPRSIESSLSCLGNRLNRVIEDMWNLEKEYFLGESSSSSGSSVDSSEGEPSALQALLELSDSE